MNDEMEISTAQLALHLIDEPSSAMRADIDTVGIDELAASIKENGLIHPINVVRKGERFEVVAGHRRLLAMRRLAWEFAPCIIRTLDDVGIAAMMATENLERSDTNPVEEALLLGRVIGEDETKIPAIAKRMNRSVEWVRGRMDILGYDEGMIRAIRDGALSLAVAQQIARVKDDSWRNSFLHDAIAHNWTRLIAEFQANLWESGALDGATEAPPAPSAAEIKAGPRGDVMCARCGKACIAPNFRSVFIHHECPAEEPSTP